MRSMGEKLKKSVEHGSERILSFRRPWKFVASSNDENELGSRKKILDPQGSFLQKWNKIFVLACVVAVSLDPLFLYVPLIGEKSCLTLDKRLQTTASILRSFTDIFYILHIVLQFRTGFIAPSSRVFGRGVLVEDSWAIAKRYLSSYFLIDILAVLPLPQVSTKRSIGYISYVHFLIFVVYEDFVCACVSIQMLKRFNFLQVVILIIIPKMSGSKVLNTKNLLKFVVIFQYFPRVLRIQPLYKEVTRTSGILTETAWAGAAFNLFLYMLASHVRHSDSF